MDKKQLPLLFKSFLISGNGISALWLLYNGIDGGFEGTPIEQFACIGLPIVLIANIVFVLKN